MLCMTVSISLWKDEGLPSKPIGEVIHWNWPFPGRVKAVYGRDFGCSSICQNPAVKSIAVKMELPDFPISLMHSLTSFMEYLSTCVCAFRALKSCTRRTPPFFFMTTNSGLLYFDLHGCTTPSFNHSATCFSTSSLWASGILNCLT